MDFIKKHYEKILLGAVLLGLFVAVFFLQFMISSERESLTEARTKILGKAVKPLPSPDTTRSENVLRLLQFPFVLDFTTTNKLFNPVQWQKTLDGHLIKRGTELSMCQVTKISPLYTIITLDSIQASDSGPRYVMGVEREAATTAAQRRKKQYYATVNNKNDAFVIREVKGPADNPTELILELNDSGERALLAKEKPFKRADGYTADLKYDPERKVWINRRVGSPISFGGEDYIIVAINKNEVVLSAKSNLKKTSIPYNPGS